MSHVSIDPLSGASPAWVGDVHDKLGFLPFPLFGHPLKVSVGLALINTFSTIHNDNIAKLLLLSTQDTFPFALLRTAKDKLEVDEICRPIGLGFAPDERATLNLVGSREDAEEEERGG